MFSDPILDVLRRDASPREVHHVLDVLLAQVQGVDQEEAFVGVRQLYLVRIHSPHCFFPSIEEDAVLLILLPADVVGDLGQGAQQIFFTIITEVLWQVHCSQ